MSTGLLGRKVGMTSVFSYDGQLVPVAIAVDRQAPTTTIEYDLPVNSKVRRCSVS